LATVLSQVARLCVGCSCRSTAQHSMCKWLALVTSCYVPATQPTSAQPALVLQTVRPECWLQKPSRLFSTPAEARMLRGPAAADVQDRRAWGRGEGHWRAKGTTPVGASAQHSTAQHSTAQAHLQVLMRSHCCSVPYAPHMLRVPPEAATSTAHLLKD
jgi:hypothetical protein